MIRPPPKGACGPLLQEALAALVRERPEELLYTTVDERGRPAAERTTLQTRTHVLAVARALRARSGLQVGERVLLIDRPGMEVIEGLLGIMHAGLVPVPLPVPVMGAGTTGAVNLVTFARDCGAAACVTSAAYAGSAAFLKLREQMEQLGVRLPWFTVDELRAGAAAPHGPGDAPFVPTPDMLALIQYTSGSTRQPRGVCVTYGNLEHQLAFQRDVIGAGPDARYVSWLPHYHDFGLIATILGAAHGNGKLVLASPTAFLRRPALWGDLLHAHRATHTAAPDFGYRLWAERSTREERSRWDLSSLLFASSGAEPIRASTVDALQEAFAPSGLRPSALAPCYGLAEHTLAVTITGRLRRTCSRSALEQSRELVASDGAGAVELFGCGAPRFGVEVRIVDPATGRSLPEGKVGEIWVQSPSVGAGYFGRETESRETFRATLAGEPGEWLRTGDLGALAGGELFVTGRLKELIILQGRNLYPQDIESVAGAAHPLVRSGNVVCFGVEDDDVGERLVVVAELQPQSPTPAELDGVRRAIRAALQQELNLGAFTLALARRGAVSRTTSGKLQRSAAREAWRTGQLPLLQSDAGLAPLAYTGSEERRTSC